MPIEASLHETEHGELNIFHVFDTLEVYDGSLALAIDHVINHIKVLVSTVYLPEDKNLLRHISDILYYAKAVQKCAVPNGFCWLIASACSMDWSRSVDWRPTRKQVIRRGGNWKT